MSIDPEQVRVDLLRIKRKLYISYPEGSPERKEFMLAAKMSELSYLQNLVTPDMVDIVFEEYIKVLKSEVTQIALGLGFGLCFSVMFYGFHTINPASFWFKLWWLPFILGLSTSSTHFYHVILNWRRLQPFKQEYSLIQNKIEKLLKEIKGLTQ